LNAMQIDEERSLKNGANDGTGPVQLMNFLRQARGLHHLGQHPASLDTVDAERLHAQC
jgi:hypothetical protein